MNRLDAELQRLFFLPGQLEQVAGKAAAALDLAGTDGMVRTVAVGFEKGAHWAAVARLHQAVQEDLELPAPAISVSGQSGYRVWFSLAQPVPADAARDFLAALRLRHLADIPLAQLKFHPGAGVPDAVGQGCLDLVPALDARSGKWSAFIDPAMGSMFVDEPGLEMAPNLDKQADLLAGFESIEADDFRRALDRLSPPAAPEGDPSEPPPKSRQEAGGRSGSRLTVGGDFSDPKSFLLAVMNDPGASAGHRIKAAKALLPYFEQERS